MKSHLPAPAVDRLAAVAEHHGLTWMNPEASPDSLLSGIRELGLLFDAIAPRTGKRDAETGSLYTAAADRHRPTPPPEPGTIVLLPPIVRMPDGRIPVAAVLGTVDAPRDNCLVVPFAGQDIVRFLGDWPADGNEHDLAILCLWNSVPLPASLLHRFPTAGRLPVSVVTEAQQLWHLLPAPGLPEAFASRTGAEIPGPLCSAWDYIEAERAIWSALSSVMLPLPFPSEPSMVASPLSPPAGSVQQWTLNTGEFLLQCQPDSLNTGSLQLLFTLIPLSGSPQPNSCRILSLSGQSWPFANARCRIPAPAITSGFVIQAPDGEVWWAEGEMV